MTIQIEIKYHYGNECLYIINEAEAQAVRSLTGKKTISRQDIKALEVLGIKVEVATPVLS